VACKDSYPLAPIRVAAKEVRELNPMALDPLKLEAQQALNELWKEQLVPFKLTVGKIVAENSSEYNFHFFDSRLRSVSVPGWQASRSKIRSAPLSKSEWQG
jgi:hypothetical protein